MSAIAQGTLTSKPFSEAVLAFDAAPDEQASTPFSQIRQMGFSLAHGASPEESNEQLESFREALLHQIEAEQGMMEAQIAKLEASPEGEAAEEGITALKDSIRALEGMKAYAANASSSQLAGMQRAMAMATMMANSQTDAARGMSAGLSGIASHMAEYYGEQYEKMTSRWSDDFKKRAAAFESDVAQHGFAGSLDRHGYSYHKAGAAHAYLLKHDEAYRYKTIELDDRAATRNVAGDKAMQTDALKRYTTPEDSASLNDIKAEIEEAKRNGEVLTQRQKEAELEARRLEAMEKAKKAAEAKGDHTAAGTIGQEQVEQRKRFEDAMRAREEQYEEHKRGLLEQGATPQQLEALQREHERSTQELGEKAKKAGYDEASIARTQHEARLLIRDTGNIRARSGDGKPLIAVHGEAAVASDNAFGDVKDLGAPSQSNDGTEPKNKAATLPESVKQSAQAAVAGSGISKATPAKEASEKQPSIVAENKAESKGAAIA